MLTQGAGCREKQLRLYHPRPVSTHPQKHYSWPPLSVSESASC